MAADGQRIDLYELNFFFAIENIDPKAGRISATYTKWTRGEKKQKQKVELIQCEYFMDGGKYHYLTTPSMQVLLDSLQIERLGKIDWLCPFNYEHL